MIAGTPDDAEAQAHPVERLEREQEDRPAAISPIKVFPELVGATTSKGRPSSILRSLSASSCRPLTEPAAESSRPLGEQFRRETEGCEFPYVGPKSNVGGVGENLGVAKTGADWLGAQGHDFLRTVGCLDPSREHAVLLTTNEANIKGRNEKV